MGKVAIFNACASSNVGDQLIGDCFVHGVTHKKINVYDLNSLTSIIDCKKTRNRSIKINKRRLFKTEFINGRKVIHIFKFIKDFKKKSRVISNLIKDVDRVVIGGGHLLIDTDLYFPLPLFMIANQAKKENKKLSVLFVGCRAEASFIARLIFRYIEKQADIVVLRDKESSYNLKCLIGDSKKISSASDVALVSDFILVGSEDKYDLALCVMAPSEIERATKIHYSDKEVIDFWLKVAELYKDRKIAIFTNGAKPDENFALELITEFERYSIDFDFLKKPRTSEDLMRIVSSTKTLVAQRLHACLPALALKKNVIGVKWDRKLECIFSENGFPDKLISFSSSEDDISKAIIKEQSWNIFNTNKQKIKELLMDL